MHGVDVNPFATAIARFRLTVAALRAEGITRLRDAPGHPMHLGTGDSLLHGKSDLGEELFDAGLGGHSYAAKTLTSTRRSSGGGATTPWSETRPTSPSGTRLFERPTSLPTHPATAVGLSVPFAELFFTLAVSDPERPGYVGQITSNSFMKREFGKKLVEEFLCSVEVDPCHRHSGAYIPGHGTPTVIMAGRRRIPRRDHVRAVLGIRGEPSAPENPAEGLVWQSIVSLLRVPELMESTSRLLIYRVRFASIPGHCLEEVPRTDVATLSDGARLGSLCLRIGFMP